MTSSGICPSCQGEVTLYQEQLEDGTIYHAGKCWNCGCYCTEYPKGYDPYKAELEAEKRAKEKDLEDRIDKADSLGGFREWVQAKLGWENFPTYKICDRYGGDTLERAFYLDEAEAMGRAICEDTYTIQRGKRLIKVDRILPTDTRYRAKFSYEIPKYAYAEDGVYFDGELATATIDEMVRLLDRHKWDMYFKFEVTEGETLIAKGNRDDFAKAFKSILEMIA